MTSSTSRHPWDPRHPKARNKGDREFEDLMAYTWFSLSSLEAGVNYRGSTTGHYEAPASRRSLRLWKLVPVASTLAFLAAYLLWVLGGDAVSNSAMLYAPMAAPLVYLGASVPARYLKQKRDQRNHFALLNTCRLSPVFVDLVEGLGQSAGGLEGCLQAVPGELKTSLNRLARARWELLAELGTDESTLPDAVLEAFDKAAIPLMAFALNVGGVSTMATESREEALVRFDERVTALVDKIEATLSDQVTDRTNVRMIGQDAVAKVEIQAIEEMSDSTGHGFEAGMSDLEDLLESSRELDA